VTVIRLPDALAGRYDRRPACGRQGAVTTESPETTRGASEAALHESKVWALAFLRSALRSQPADSYEGPAPQADPVERGEWGVEFDFADHDEWARVSRGPDWSWGSSVGWFMVGSDGADAGELIDVFDASDVARAARSSELLDVRRYDSRSR
jgi:hypothetical protein